MSGIGPCGPRTGAEFLLRFFRVGRCRRTGAQTFNIAGFSAWARIACSTFATVHTGFMELEWYVCTLWLPYPTKQDLEVSCSPAFFALLCRSDNLLINTLLPEDGYTWPDVRPPLVQVAT